MISTQAQALTARDVLTAGVYTVEQCNQIANISKRTIKAAIIGVPIAEVIEKFGNVTDWSKDSYNPGKGASYNPGKGASYNPGKGASYNPGKGASIQQLNQKLDAPQSKLTDGQMDGWILEYPGKSIRAIYKAVDQIKTKYGQVRPQDIARLNNRAEQKLIECRKTALSEVDVLYQE